MMGGNSKTGSAVDDDLIKEVGILLAEDKQVRRILPGKGSLNIDRNLPFLCVYRRPSSRPDSGTDQLIKGEASFLIVSSDSNYKPGVSSLLKTIVESLSKIPGAFLIIEIWTRESPLTIIDPEKGRTAPSFRIFVPQNRIPVETVESLRSALTRITVSKNKAEAETVFSNRPWPEDLPSLLSSKDIQQYNCFLIGLEISPIYRDPDSGKIFPLVLKKMHRGLSFAFKKCEFEFSHKHTTTRPSNYKSLGSRAVVKAVWEVDHQLAEIGDSFDFLLLVTPVNIEQSWNKFRSCKFDCEPVFYYRPIPIDPSVLKRKLYDIPFDRIEDPTLLSIFHEKLVELELKFSMLRDRRTRNFFYCSMQLFGEFDHELVRLAKSILKKFPPHSHELSGSKKVDAGFFADRARLEIERYREIFPGIESKVIIRDDIPGLMTSRGNLHIGKRVKIPESRVEALIQHEVGTHILTYVNGLNQPFQQLYCGLAGCDELQEGLAVLSEFLVGGLSPPRIRLLAGRVLAAEMLIHGATFIETFRELNCGLGFSAHTAYIITSRIFRSGGFTKDAIYLRGLVYLLNYLRNGGELLSLLVGKVSIEDIPLIKELQFRKVLKPSLLTPHYLNSPEAMSRLNDIMQGSIIFDLI